ncbi:hypothetical protein D3C85_1271360 [compost metagenome]
MEPFEAGQHRALVAGVQPLGAQLALRLGPGGAKGPHAFCIGALHGQADRIDIPRQLRRIGAPPRPRNGRIDHHQPRQPGRAGTCRPDADAATHRMADDLVARKAQRLGECHHVRRLCIEAVVERIPSRRQAPSAHIEHIGIESLAKTLTDETPGNGRAGDARDDDHRVAPFAPSAGAAVAQVVLADAVRVDVAAVQESAHAAPLPSRRPTAACRRPAPPPRGPVP